MKLTEQGYESRARMPLSPMAVYRMTASTPATAPILGATT